MVYESHITVIDIHPNIFRSRCQQLGVKSLLIEKDTGSNNLPQLMTAKFHNVKSYDKAFSEMMEIASNFKHIRLKLEQIVSKNEKVECQYQEFHSKFELNKGDQEEFLKIVADNGAHSSVNTLQKHSGLFYFVTTRNEKHHERLIKSLHHYKILSTIRECVVYDNNPSIDSGWYECKGCGFKTYPIGINYGT